MQSDPPAGKYCSFMEHENYIWEFCFLKCSNEAVDEWVAWQNYLSKRPHIPDVTTVRTLLDFRPDGLVSMMYALQKNAEWRRHTPDVQSVPVKVAIVLKPINRVQQAYGELIKEGINVFGMRTVRLELFADAYQEAIDWLLED